MRRGSSRIHTIPPASADICWTRSSLVTTNLHTARFDQVTDQTVDCTQSCDGKQCVLLLDGIFLHRPELREFWACSIFLDVPFDTTFARMASRDGTLFHPLWQDLPS